MSNKTNDLFEELKKIIKIPDEGVVSLTLHLKVDEEPILEIISYASPENQTGALPQTVTNKYKVVKL